MYKVVDKERFERFLGFKPKSNVIGFREVWGSRRYLRLYDGSDRVRWIKFKDFEELLEEGIIEEGVIITPSESV